MKTLLKLAICDDLAEPVEYTKQLSTEWSLLKEYPISIDCFDNGDSLLVSLSKTSYDIIFLDIIMPMLSGMDTATEIRRNNTSVKLVFLSSSSEYGVESYTVQASNYLLKPLQKETFFEALNRLTTEIFEEPKTLLCKSSGMVHKIPIQDIEYVEAQDKYAMIALHQKQSIKVLEPLYKLEERLLQEDGFFKCHRSYIINMRYVNSFNTKEIKMLSQSIIPISRMRAKEFQDIYFSFVFENERR